MRKSWVVILQAVLSLLVIGRFVQDPTLRSEISRILATASSGWLLTGFCTALISEFFCAVRWCLLLRTFGTPIPLKRVLLFCGAGLFFSLSLPGGAGGDALRAIYGIQIYPNRKLRIALSILGDRLCGFVALSLTFLATGLQGGFSLDPSAEVYSVVAAARWVLGSTLLLMCLWSLSTLSLTKKLWVPAFLRSLRRKADRFSRIFAELASRPRSVSVGVLVSILSLGAHFSTYFCSARAFEVDVQLAQMLTVMPIVDALVMLPISFSGVGVREVLFERLLGGYFGVPAASAVLASAGGFVLQVLVAGLGGVLTPLALRDAGLPTKAIHDGGQHL
jgi:uncharacterized protein (TIRG00374 family)